MHTEKNYKRIIIYINDSQKNALQEFLHSINFHYYTIQTKLQGCWEFGIRHLNTHVWPGSEAVFHLVLKDEHVKLMIKNLKKFRMDLPSNIVMAVMVTPIDEFYYNMETAEIPYTEEELKTEKKIKWV